MLSYSPLVHFHLLPLSSLYFLTENKVLTVPCIQWSALLLHLPKYHLPFQTMFGASPAL